VSKNRMLTKIVGSVTLAWLLATALIFSVDWRKLSNQTVVGVYADPWKGHRIIASELGVCPGAIGQFETWTENRGLSGHFAEADEKGISTYIITWEPWERANYDVAPKAQGSYQPLWSNTTIENGVHDAYISNFAQSVRSAKAKVIIRFGHEMNGFWYPWSHDPDAFIQAWRRIYNIFQNEKAFNAEFNFSINPNLYQPKVQWSDDLLAYWPGDEYVDSLGLTMINFGGEKNYSVAQFEDRISYLVEEFKKPVVITEFSLPPQEPDLWIKDFDSLLERRSEITHAFFSPKPSRYLASQGLENPYLENWTRIPEIKSLFARWGSSTLESCT